jgi:outer membrane protein assembly factor BamB
VFLAFLLAGCAGRGAPGPSFPASPAAPAPAAASAGSGPASPSPPPAAWPTYHRDGVRSGFDPGEPPARDVRRVWVSPELDGAVYAEPLAVGDRVFVATEGDSVYALDAASGRVLWRTHLGEPVRRSQLPCGNVDPSGITGTPVVDAAAGRLYAVAFVQPGRFELVTLDAGSGAVLARRSVEPPGFRPLVQQQRGALALANGRVYVPFGGLFGDCGDYHGWVVGFPVADGGSPVAYQVPTRREGGIWAPPEPAVDGAGDLWVTTGNGSSADAYDWGDSVLRLSPDLRLLDSFAPADWADLNRADLDLGSIGPTLLKGGLVLQTGKTGMGYLLRADRLGGVGGQLFAAPVCRNVGGYQGAYGATAYAPPYVYVPCRDGLAAVRLEAGPRFAVAWHGPRFPAGPPIVAGGVVWTLDLAGGELYGFDPPSGAVRFRLPVGPLPHFASPASGGGRIFVPSGDRVVAFSGV